MELTAPENPQNLPAQSTPDTKPEANKTAQDPQPTDTSATVKAPPPAPKKSHKKLFIIVGVITVLILIIGLLGIMTLSSSTKNQQPVAKMAKPTPTSTPKLINANIIEAKTVLTDFQKSLNTNSTLNSNSSNWLLGNGKSNNLTGYGFSLAVTNSKEDNQIVDAYKTVPGSIDDQGNTIYDPELMLQIINELEEKSDGFFKSNGFTSNTLNSKKSSNLAVSTLDGTKQNGISITKAYEKNGVYCFTKLNQAIYTYATFYCGVTDEAKNQLQNTIGKDIQKDLNTTNDPDVVYNLGEVIGDFASGGVGSRNGSGGKEFWAKKINDKWTAIYVTQNGGLPCSIAQKYDVPKEWTETCMTSTPTPTKGFN